MKEELIEMVVSSVATITAVVISHKKTAREQRKDFARHRLLHMIMEDQLYYEMFKKLPRNYSAILKDYDIYHKNSGNGEITLKVDEYKRWYDSLTTDNRK